MPLKKIAKGGLVQGFLAGHCATCGSPYHSNRRCNKTGTIGACNYEHDDSKDLQPHKALTCPVLHNYCGECFMRGHDPSAHKKQTATQPELRQHFFGTAASWIAHVGAVDGSSSGQEGKNVLVTLEAWAFWSILKTRCCQPISFASLQRRADRLQ